jgi:exopolyphosphatase/guanosine-5'-triphosphate,3'-diphosphate pyrophosphatase
VSGDSFVPAGFTRRAVIDIGTNSVKLLVGDVRDGEVVPVWETSEQTRLGRGFYETRRLQAEPIAATAAVVARFAVMARSFGATTLRAVATSAAREALNSEDLLGAIRSAAQVEVEVISGDQEAELGFQGVASAPGYARRRLLILDVGGGSTECMLGRGGPREFRHSFPLGSVRLQERFQPADPPGAGQLGEVRHWLDEYVTREIVPGLQPRLDKQGLPDQVFGVGGTTAILAQMHQGRRSFDRDLVDSTVFSAAELTTWVERLWSLSLEERRQLPGLPPERADVILFGTAIYEAVLRRFQLPQLGASTRGLRFAALLTPGPILLGP